MIITTYSIMRAIKLIRATAEIVAVLIACAGVYLLVSTCSKPDNANTYRGSWDAPAQTDEEMLRELEMAHQMILDRMILDQMEK